MMALFITELKKTRRRHIGLVYGAALCLMLLWALWAMSGMADRNDIIAQQGYYYLLANFPIMNSFILPVIIACAESRLCDIEQKGNTFKLLCTMQPRHSIYHMKLLVSFLYLIIFTLAQTALILWLCSFFRVDQPLPAENILLFFLANLTVGTVLAIIQQSLSLLSDNQLFPLFAGVGGTFMGIFSGFLPWIPIQRLLPWGYYSVFLTVSLDYDKAGRTVIYYPVPFAFRFYIGFVIFGIIAYLIGKDRFMKKEV